MLNMFCQHVFGNILGGFAVFHFFFWNFAGPQPRKISEALFFFLHVGCQQTSSQNLLAIIILVKQTEKY